MGLSSSKSKTVQNNDPWAPAQPYILNGLQQTQDVFQANQPTLQQMSETAQDAYNQIAPLALGTNGFAQAAQTTAQSIANGKYVGTNPGSDTYAGLMHPAADPSMSVLSGLTGGGSNAAMPGLSRMAYGGPGIAAQGVRTTSAPNPGNAAATATAGGAYLGANPGAAYYASELAGDHLGGSPSASFYADTLGGKYLGANPYLDGIVKSSNDDATKAINARFAASGMGEGMSTAYAGALGSALSGGENALRYQAYNDELSRMGQIGAQADATYAADRDRQAQAAGQADAAFGAERGRMDDAASLLSSNYNAAADRGLTASQANAANALDAAKTNASLRMSALGQLSDASNQQFGNALNAATALGQQYLGGQQSQLSAAKAADDAYAAQLAQITQSLGLVPGLADAQYTGVAPALSLLNAAATAPYLGISAYNGGINGLSNGYGVQTTTTKSTPSVMEYITQMQNNAARAAAAGA